MASCSEAHLSGRDAYLVVCPRCGEFEITRQAKVGLPRDDQELRPFLSAHTRQTWELSRQRAVITTNWQPLAEAHSRMSMSQRLDKLMELARRRSAEPGESFEFTAQLDYPVVDAQSAKSAAFVLAHACDVALLVQSDLSRLEITFKGWEYLESSVSGGGAPRRAFVAMSFDPQLTDAYDHGIHPALAEDCGIECVRMDRVEHTEKICDRILADIRRCQLIVADFTLQRPGVYFEAGFALALNRTVIWTVREDEIDKVHFDTRQYNHIVWQTPTDLRTRLGVRIQAIDATRRR